MTADTQPREAPETDSAPTSHEAVARFVAETAALTQPDPVSYTHLTLPTTPYV